MISFKYFYQEKSRTEQFLQGNRQNQPRGKRGEDYETIILRVTPILIN